MKHQTILGMDVGGTHTRMGIVDRKLRVQHLHVIPSISFQSSDNSVKMFIAEISRYLDKYDSEKQVTCIAAGFPSLVDKSRRVLVSSTNFPGFDGVDIVSELEDALHLAVMIEHDAYYLLAYDLMNYSDGVADIATGFYFGTGMGNGIFLQGRPFLGAHGGACEIGHMPVPFGERACSCGNTGCIEMYCCGKALEKMVADSFPNTSIKEVFATHGNSTDLDDFVRYMAVPIASEINILDPEVVFIGGGVVFMKDFPKQKLVRYIKQNLRHPSQYYATRLEFSTNSPENGIIGAAIMAFGLL